MESENKNVVFIHGAWSTGNVWNNYKTYFSERGFTTSTPTFLHHTAERNTALIGTSMEDYVDQLRKILKTFAALPIVVAHSMGCIIAQRLAVEGLVKKMVLIAPPASYGMMPPSKSLKSVKWVNRVKKLRNNLAKPTFEQAIDGILNNLPLEKQKEVYSKMTYESGKAMGEMIWIKNIFGKKPNKIAYSKIDIPVLFIAGGADNASPIELSQKIRKKYKSSTTLKTFEKNAHWMLEESNWNEIATYIVDWIEHKS